MFSFSIIMAMFILGFAVTYHILGVQDDNGEVLDFNGSMRHVYLILYAGFDV